MLLEARTRMIAQKLNVRVGSEFLIQLPSNRTTGHKWEADYDRSFLQLSTSSYKPASTELGAGGTESFTFNPCKKGITRIRMLYKRSWEKTNAKEAVYEITIG